jgi:tetratricopeptide (TPR) repeat protein
MIITYYCIVTLLIIAYLLGSIPSAVWIGKRYYGVDVREHGSKNAGTTNVLRVLGARAAAPVFAIDFLKDGLSSSPSVEKFENNLTEAKVLIEDFKKYIPYEERAYVAEAELYQNQGDFAKAKAALQIGIKKVAVAPQCCMKLADMSLKLGRYDDVIKYARQGILAATQDQPTISVGYLHYILALAMDAKRIQCRQAGQSFDEIEIRKIINEFTTADRLLINEGRPDVAYRRTIKARLIVLEMEENIAVEIDQPDNKETHEGSPVRLSDILQIQQMLENAKKGVL